MTNLVVDQFTRECVALAAKLRPVGSDLADLLDQAIRRRGRQVPIIVWVARMLPAPG